MLYKIIIFLVIIIFTFLIYFSYYYYFGWKVITFKTNDMVKIPVKDIKKLKFKSAIFYFASEKKDVTSNFNIIRNGLLTSPSKVVELKLPKPLSICSFNNTYFNTKDIKKNPCTDEIVNKYPTKLTITYKEI